eukprot:GEMP01017426.1.p1 GENE.GEMP01017426.1~~GEMP01017426.1.p1  ORF type:complete len:738 (+),score=151.94 GEMP01017426.1:135-2348(+)
MGRVVLRELWCSTAQSCGKPGNVDAQLPVAVFCSLLQKLGIALPDERVLEDRLMSWSDLRTILKHIGKKVPCKSKKTLRGQNDALHPDETPAPHHPSLAVHTTTPHHVNDMLCNGSKVPNAYSTQPPVVAPPASPAPAAKRVATSRCHSWPPACDHLRALSSGLNISPPVFAPKKGGRGPGTPRTPAEFTTAGSASQPESREDDLPLTTQHLTAMKCERKTLSTADDDVDCDNGMREGDDSGTCIRDIMETKPAYPYRYPMCSEQHGGLSYQSMLEYDHLFGHSSDGPPNHGRLCYEHHVRSSYQTRSGMCASLKGLTTRFPWNETNLPPPMGDAACVAGDKEVVLSPDVETSTSHTHASARPQIHNFTAIEARAPKHLTYAAIAGLPGPCRLPAHVRPAPWTTTTVALGPTSELRQHAPRNGSLFRHTLPVATTPCTGDAPLAVRDMSDDMPCLTHRESPRELTNRIPRADGLAACVAATLWGVPSDTPVFSVPCAQEEANHESAPFPEAVRAGLHYDCGLRDSTGRDSIMAAEDKEEEARVATRGHVGGGTACASTPWGHNCSQLSMWEASTVARGRRRQIPVPVIGSGTDEILKQDGARKENRGGPRSLGGKWQKDNIPAGYRELLPPQPKEEWPFLPQFSPPHVPRHADVRSLRARDRNTVIKSLETFEDLWGRGEDSTHQAGLPGSTTKKPLPSSPPDEQITRPKRIVGEAKITGIVPLSFYRSATYMNAAV